MKIVKKSQIEDEHKAFQQSLDFFKQENALLKYRLSEIVDDNEESGFLQLAEYFQNELLLKDEKLTQLTKKLHQLFETFQELQDAESLPERFLVVQDEFRNSLLNFEKNFLILSKEFNERMGRKT